jgi:hypothetical protein
MVVVRVFAHPLHERPNHFACLPSDFRHFPTHRRPPEALRPHAKSNAALTQPFADPSHDRALLPELMLSAARRAGSGTQEGRGGPPLLGGGQAALSDTSPAVSNCPPAWFVAHRRRQRRDGRTSPSLGRRGRGPLPWATVRIRAKSAMGERTRCECCSPRRFKRPLEVLHRPDHGRLRDSAASFHRVGTSISTA